MDYQEIISKLPYSKPFLFVDEIIEINENGVKGSYTFDENLDFYKGHFTNNPVTPGVILTEVLNDNFNKETTIALTSTNMEFLKPVFPKEKVSVISEKIYFRFGKLKCKVIMNNENNEVVCFGEIAGMII